MKPEYPVLLAVVSKYIADPIIFLLSAFFISSFYLDYSITELATICITTFGVIVSLARLSFSIKFNSESKTKSTGVIHAGTKLSHAAVLCIQLLFIVLAQHIVDTKIVGINPTLTQILNSILKLTWAFISILTMCSTYWALSSLNNLFFGDWKLRVEQNNKRVKS